MVFVVLRQQVVKDFYLTMIGEAEVADTSCLPLFNEEIEYAVVDIPAVQRIHSAHADTVQQVVVDIIHLQFLEGVVVHLKRFLTRPGGFIEIRQFGGHIVTVTRMTVQGGTCGCFRLTLTIDRTGVEIVHAVLQRIIDQTVDLLLVDLAFFIFFCVTNIGQTHHTVTQQRHLFVAVGIGAVGHLALRRLHLMFIIICCSLFLRVLTAGQRDSCSCCTCAEYLQKTPT